MVRGVAAACQGLALCYSASLSWEHPKSGCFALHLGLADKDSCVGHLVHDNLSTEHIQQHNSATRRLADQKRTAQEAHLTTRWREMSGLSVQTGVNI